MSQIHIPLEFRYSFLSLYRNKHEKRFASCEVILMPHREQFETSFWKRIARVSWVNRYFHGWTPDISINKQKYSEKRVAKNRVKVRELYSRKSILQRHAVPPGSQPPFKKYTPLLYQKWWNSCKQPANNKKHMVAKNFPRGYLTLIFQFPIFGTLGSQLPIYQVTINPWFQIYRELEDEGYITIDFYM